MILNATDMELWLSKYQSPWIFNKSVSRVLEADFDYRTQKQTADEGGNKELPTTHLQKKASSKNEINSINRIEIKPIKTVYFWKTLNR